jgi:hypothetical protein
MESLEIPHIAEQTVNDASFSTPFLEDITHGQRNNSRLFHTREDNEKPYYYHPKHIRSTKIHVACSNDVFAKCKAKLILNSKDQENLLKIEREAKKSLFKFTRIC